ncbi:hypothetical protein, partial [Nonomuraea antimicrobica]|uniref:hypothetical protein n=1 Tax=Nonomuraea antimicrobica TaxID=561173 RepID=UPI0031E72194
GGIDIYSGAVGTHVVGNAVALPVGQWVRLEWRYTIDGSGNGTVEMWTYLSADSTAHDDYVVSSTVAWPGGKPRDVEFHLGRDTTSQMYVDEVAVSDVKIGSAVPQIAAPVGVITESDTARSITVRKVRNVAQAPSVEVALPIRPAKVRRVGQVVEVDSAVSVARRKVHAVGQVVESGTVAQVVPAHRRIIGQVVEIDTAAKITPDVGNVSRAIE